VKDWVALLNEPTDRQNDWSWGLSSRKRNYKGGMGERGGII